MEIFPQIDPGHLFSLSREDDTFRFEGDLDVVYLRPARAATLCWGAGSLVLLAERLERALRGR